MCVNLQHSQPQNKWKRKFKWGKNQPLMATKLPNLQSTIIFGNHLLSTSLNAGYFQFTIPKVSCVSSGKQVQIWQVCINRHVSLHRSDGIYNKRLQVSILIDVLGHYPAKPSGQDVGPKFYFRFCGLNKHAHPCTKDDVQYLLLFSCPTRVR